MLEAKSRANARKGLKMAINDLVEMVEPLFTEETGRPEVRLAAYEQGIK